MSERVVPMFESRISEPRWRTLRHEDEAKMKKSDVELSVVIVNYNTGDLLENCLVSLTKEPIYKDEMEIFVVDNASSDGSDEVESLALENLELIRNKENAGFARANNQALKLCSGRFILLLNPDTIIFPGALTKMTAFLDSEKSIGAAGAVTWLDEEKSLEVCTLKLPRPGSAFWAFTPFRRLKKAEKMLQKSWKIDHELFLKKNDAIETEGLGGACFMLRREAFRSIGLLDERFFMGYEDTDWSYRLKKAGWGTAVLSSAEIVHYFGQSKKKRASVDSDLYHWDTGLLQFLKKYYPPYRLAPFILSMKTADILAGIASKIKYPRPEKPAIFPSEPQKKMESVEIKWQITNPENPPYKYIFELSNSPVFFDKFGRVISDWSIRLPATLLKRFSAGLYYWRVFGLAEDLTVSESPLDSGLLNVDGR